MKASLVLYKTLPTTPSFYSLVASCFRQKYYHCSIKVGSSVYYLSLDGMEVSELSLVSAESMEIIDTHVPTELALVRIERWCKKAYDKDEDSFRLWRNCSHFCYYVLYGRECSPIMTPDLLVKGLGYV